MDLAQFISIKNIDELAQGLKFSVDSIRRVVYVNDYSKNYRLFFLPKKNGDLRVIQAPKGKLRKIQGKLGDYLTKIYAIYAPEHAHGFVLKKSIVTNAETHIQQNWVMNCDLSDFYGSIHYYRVKRLFESSPFHFNSEVSNLLAKLCTTRTGLPQGAPTSSTISNMIAFELDHRLTNLAEKRGYRYSRYADDITFSSNRSFATDMVELERVPHKEYNDELVTTGKYIVGEMLENIIKACGFQINPNKTRLQSRYERQVVTGLCVNEKVNVDRKFIRDVRGMIHAYKTYGIDATEHVFCQKYSKRHFQYRIEKNGQEVLISRKTSFLDVLLGKLSFIKMVKGEDNPIYLKLLVSLYGDLYKYGHLTLPDKLNITIHRGCQPYLPQTYMQNKIVL